MRDLPTEKAAWIEIGKLNLEDRINEPAVPGPILFCELGEHYLRADFGSDAMRPKSDGTMLNMNHIVHDYLIPRFGQQSAEDIKTLDIQRWLKTLHVERGLAWTTVSKIRGIMLRVYKIEILYELVSRNPVQPVETRCTTDYRAIMLAPQQTRAVLRALSSPLHRILVLTCAATALRASELVALRWADIRIEEGRIRVSKRWSRGQDGPTKTARSNGFAPLHPGLERHLRAWKIRTPYGRDHDFVKAHGRTPISPGVFVSDHLRPAAIKAGCPGCGRPSFRPSQSSPLAVQLDGEQGKGGTQNGAGHLAPLPRADDAHVPPRKMRRRRWRPRERICGHS